MVFVVCFQYEEDEEIGEDGEPRARAKKQKKRTTKKSIFDVSSPRSWFLGCHFFLNVCVGGHIYIVLGCVSLFNLQAWG